MKITIITVCFNSSETVLDALRSIHSQDLQELEHIIIDGGPTDGTIELIKGFGRYDLLISEKDDGIYDAMNKGIKLAKGDIIGFLNSDDLYASDDVLSKVVDVFEKDSSMDACYADLFYVDKVKIDRKIRYWKSGELKPGAFANGWSPPHPTFFVRRSVYDRYGLFDQQSRTAADFELMMRLLEVHKISVRYVPEVWVNMRTGGTSNGNLKSIWKQNLEVLHALRSHGLAANPILYFGHKFLLRGRQFFQRPSM